MTFSAHFTLQGKGGVGKSLTAAYSAQSLVARGLPVQCFDTDPTNATLFGFKGLAVERVNLLDNGGSVVVERRFDDMIERIAAEPTNFVIDNGATSFLPFTSYMLENDVIGVLQAAGKSVVVHTVVTGGQAQADTLNGFDALASQLPPGVGLVLWLNEFFGEILLKGKPFEESNIYKQHRERLHGLVRLHRYTSSTFGTDVAQMLNARLTFDQVAKSEDFGMMAKSRIHRVSTDVMGQLAKIVTGGKRE